MIALLTQLDAQGLLGGCYTNQVGYYKFLLCGVISGGFYNVAKMLHFMFARMLLGGWLLGSC